MRGVPRGVAAALFIVVAELSRAHVVARPVVTRVVHRVRECGAVRARAGQDVMLVRHVAYAIDTLFLFTECDLLAESVSRPRLIDRVAMKRPEVPGDHLAVGVVPRTAANPVTRVDRGHSVLCLLAQVGVPCHAATPCRS